MKILHITHTHVKTDSRILKEISALAESGFRVSAIGSNADKSNNGEASVNNVNIIEVNTWTRKFKIKPKFLKHALSVLELSLRIIPIAIKLKPNVIHVHDTVVLLPGVILKKINGAKLIYDAHELESDRNGLNKITGYLVRCFEKVVWKYIDGIIIVSPSIKFWYNNNMGYKKSEVIYNSPVINNGKVKNKNYLREKYNIERKAKIFIYVGILEKGRGIDLIIEAFKNSLIKSHIVFMGYGVYYEKLVETSKEFKNIHVHPAVIHSEVVEIIRTADFGVCLVENVSLSDYFCLPNKLFEYFFAKVPVLASNFPDIKQFVTNNKCGILCEVNLESVLSKISEIENNTYEYEFINIEEFTWDRQKEKLISFYKNNFFETER